MLSVCIPIYIYGYNIQVTITRIILYRFMYWIRIVYHILQKRNYNNYSVYYIIVKGSKFIGLLLSLKNDSKQLPKSSKNGKNIY